jgi:hypothetical protein
VRFWILLYRTTWNFDSYDGETLLDTRTEPPVKSFQYLTRRSRNRSWIFFPREGYDLEVVTLQDYQTGRLVTEATLQIEDRHAGVHEGQKYRKTVRRFLGTRMMARFPWSRRRGPGPVHPGRWSTTGSPTSPFPPRTRRRCPSRCAWCWARASTAGRWGRESPSIPPTASTAPCTALRAHQGVRGGVRGPAGDGRPLRPARPGGRLRVLLHGVQDHPQARGGAHPHPHLPRLHGEPRPRRGGLREAAPRLRRRHRAVLAISRRAAAATPPASRCSITQRYQPKSTSTGSSEGAARLLDLHRGRELERAAVWKRTSALRVLGLPGEPRVPEVRGGAEAPALARTPGCPRRARCCSGRRPGPCSAPAVRTVARC